MPCESPPEVKEASQGSASSTISEGMMKKEGEEEDFSLMRPHIIKIKSAKADFDAVRRRDFLARRFGGGSVPFSALLDIEDRAYKAEADAAISAAVQQERLARGAPTRFRSGRLVARLMMQNQDNEAFNHWMTESIQRGRLKCHASTTSTGERDDHKEKEEEEEEAAAARTDKGRGSTSGTLTASSSSSAATRLTFDEDDVIMVAPPREKRFAELSIAELCAPPRTMVRSLMSLTVNEAPYTSKYGDDVAPYGTDKSLTVMNTIGRIE